MRETRLFEAPRKCTRQNENQMHDSRTQQDIGCSARLLGRVNKSSSQLSLWHWLCA